MPKKKHEKRWLSSPKLEGVKWVYANGWYDYVLTGVVLYEGRRYFAYCDDENYNKRKKWWRRYVVVDMTEDAWKDEDVRHAFFVEKVGSHFDFIDDSDTGKQVRNRDGLKPSGTWQEYYDRYPPQERDIDYKQFPVVGWFEV